MYNVVGERIYFAGIGGFDDGMEQPFHSLDFIYSYFPTERISFKIRVKNMLDSKLVVSQGDVDIIVQEIGTTVLFNLKWDM